MSIDHELSPAESVQSRSEDVIAVLFAFWCAIFVIPVMGVFWLLAKLRPVKEVTANITPRR